MHLPVQQILPVAYGDSEICSDGQVHANARGMSLIEIMMVLAVVGLIVGSILTGLGSGRVAESTRASNQLANTIRFAFNKARVTGAHIRMHIDLDAGLVTLQKADEAMYLPATDRDGRLTVIDESRQRERDERDKQIAEQYNRSIQGRALGVGARLSGNDTDDAPAADTDLEAYDPYATPPKTVPRRKPPLFSAFTEEDDQSHSELRKPLKFPATTKIKSVRTSDDFKATTEGDAYLYFFPQGRTQQAHIQIVATADETDGYTIITHPLTGRIEVKDGLIDLELPTDPRDAEDDLGEREQRRAF